MKTRTLQDKLERHSGKRELKDTKKFKRSVRSRVEDDGQQIVDSHYYGWREGGGSHFWRLLPKWLKSRVGHRWSAVYSDLCSQIKDKDLIQDVLKYKVEFNVSMTSGQLCYLDTGFCGGFIPVNSKECFYVYHDVLHYSPKAKKKSTSEETNCFVCESGAFIRKDSNWYEIDRKYIEVDCWYARFLTDDEKKVFSIQKDSFPTRQLRFNGKLRLMYARLSPLCVKDQLSSKEVKKLIKKFPEAAKITNHV